MSDLLEGKICLVTGATRGIGKGIALQLGANGAKVYITGRTLETSEGSTVKGSLRDTAEEIEGRGGICIPVQCDNAKDEEVERLFERIKRENDGQLDILVNNAFTGTSALIDNFGRKFWEQSASIWDEMNAVGLRNHYLCSVYAARMMVPRKRGLIVNISSEGGMRFLFNAAYGIGKEACDRMAADCAFELRKSNVAFVSLWPGKVRTEFVEDLLRQPQFKSAPFLACLESMEFPGKCVVGLAKDPDIMNKSGRILLTPDLAREYGFTDGENYNPEDIRQVKYLLQRSGYVKTSSLVPSFLRIPKWLLYFGGYKM